MTDIPAGPAGPLQIAMYGHIAVALRAALAAKDWTLAELNQAIGRDRAHAGVYQYLAAKSAPRPEIRIKIAEVLGLPEAVLMRRKPGEAAPKAAPMASALLALPQRLAAPRPRPGPATTADAPVLQFTANADGTTRLTVDVTLAAERAVPLLRILLDAGMIVARE